MVNLEHIKQVYFIGIGGIGMSALARYFNEMGYIVGGYDKTLSPLTETMSRREGISVSDTDEVSAIPEVFQERLTTLVIYTPAVPENCKQLGYFRKSGFSIYKRAEILGVLSQSGKAICVAGTHGKTTVSTMVAYLLKNTSVGCSAFLGGISMNFGTNLLIDKKSPYIVIEADEFDRSFLHLTPEIAVITSMDEDHLDIYQNKAGMTEAFEMFAQRVRPEGGILYAKKGLILEKTKVAGYYGVEVDADCYSDNLRVVDGRYIFNYHGKDETITDITLGIPGRVNVENATAAITLALEAGVTPTEVKMFLPEFRGVLRRFNIHLNDGERIYIDDYAHHPKEIEAVLASVREMWPGQKLIVAFQPHLYSRTYDFYESFAESLSIADEVLLLDIYPAREQPIPGVTSRLIADRLTVPGKIVSKEELIGYVAGEFHRGILMTLGAGDIDRLVPKIKLEIKN